MSFPLREIGRVDHQSQNCIKDGMKGVTFDYQNTGKRIGQKGQIALSVTSIVTDWEKNIFYRTCRYLGHHEGWKRCIRSHIIKHLTYLGVGIMQVRAMTGDFEANKIKCKKM
ncbi:MAG TPA: hypothetical protein VLN72_06065 [Gillisia sp.]|nr:hypothetical protein [Gillisia sp.]